ncbi:XdhC family protein [Peribacillus frigoritolerans]|uniref:XdhC family protein n=1 Tax=Peribacillus frigoritolerans TaxID=450367 RepID=UPI0039A262C9
MSRLQELKDVLDNIRSAWQRHEKAAMVMQIGVKGSAYRLPGAKMMMATDGHMFGTISGGCLESDLYGWAEKAMETNTCVTHQYDLSENEIWGLGIGCKGKLDISILPIEPDDEFWMMTNQIIQKGQKFTMILDVSSGKGLIVDKHGNLIGNHGSVPSEVVEKARMVMDTQTRAELMNLEGKRYLIDAIKPSEHLIIAGAGRDAVPVAELAAKAGFFVTVLDSRKDFNNDRLFPLVHNLQKSPDEIDPSEYTGSWWVVMNHIQSLDEKTLQVALKSDPRYIGVLGPISRTTEMLDTIGENFNSGPIHSPIGLDIGAETMEEVAISIVSELMSVRNGRIPAPLHGKVKIHA